MDNNTSIQLASNDEILIYQSQDSIIKIDVLFENETVWLNQNQFNCIRWQNCFCSKEMQQSRIWRAKQNEGNVNTKSSLLIQIIIKTGEDFTLFCFLDS